MSTSYRVAAVVVAGLVSLGATACKKKDAPAAGAGTGTAAGSGTASGSGSGTASGSGSGSGTATGSGSGTAAGSGSAAVAPTGDAPPPAGADQPALPTDLPPFAVTAGADAAKSKQLVSDARAAIRADDPDPIPLAIAAVRADPGSPRARLALACAVDDPAYALAQLTPLTKATAADCPDCNDLVLDLAGGGGDCDWSEPIRALAATGKPTPQRAAATAITDSLASGNPAPAAPFFKAAKVTYTIACSVCDEGEGDTKQVLAGAKLLAKLIKQVKTAQTEGAGTIVVGESLVCAADCCEIEVGMLMHNHDFLSSICFAPGTDQVSRLHIISGG